MYKKYKIFIILVFWMLTIISFLPSVYASNDTCKLTITPNKTQANAGDEIILNLTVSDITSKNGIAIYNGIVEYDADVFELSIQDGNDGKWKGDLIENSVTFTKADLEATKESQEIGKIVLKIKNEAPTGEQKITLKNNEFADESSFKIADITTSIEITEKNDNNSNNNSNNNNNNSNNSNSNNNNNDNSNNNSNSNDNNNNSNNIYNGNKNNNNTNTTFIVGQENKQTTSNKETNSNTENNTTKQKSNNSKKLPNAGIIGIRFVLILLIITTIIGIYSFNKYKKMKY